MLPENQQCFALRTGEIVRVDLGFNLRGTRETYVGVFDRLMVRPEGKSYAVIIIEGEVHTYFLEQLRPVSALEQLAGCAE